MRINVTQQDIDNGLRCNQTHCPIAIAVYRCAALSFAVYSINMRYKEFNIQLPASVQEFIESFDNNKEVQPFSFEVNLYN